MKTSGKNRTVFQERFNTLIKNSTKYDRVGVAKKLGVSVDTINKYMRSGAKIPPLDIVSKIAKLFGVDCGYLLGDCDYKTREIEATAVLLGLSEQAVDGLIKLGIQHKDGIKLLLEKHSAELEDVLYVLSLLITIYGQSLIVYKKDGKKELINKPQAYTEYKSGINELEYDIREIIEKKINYKDYLGIDIPPELLPKKQ